MTQEPTKQWQARNVKLTDEQRAEVINSKDTLANLAKKFGISDRAISAIRKKAGTAKKRIVLTDDQKQEIRESNLTGVELVEMYKSNPATISKIRQGHYRPKEKPVKSPPKKKKTINKLETTFEREQKEREKSIRLSEDFKNTTEQKLASGDYVWVDVFPRGKALRKKV